MSRRPLYRQLAECRQLLSVASKEFAAAFGTEDHPRIGEARSLISSADDALVQAAGGVSGLTRTLTEAVVLTPVCWLAAEAFTKLGLAGGWTIGFTLGVFVALFWPSIKVLAWWSRVANARRVPLPEWASAPRPEPGVTAPLNRVPARQSDSAGRADARQRDQAVLARPETAPPTAADVQRALATVRRAVIAIGLHQLRTGHPARIESPLDLLWARHWSTAVDRLSIVDLCLCRSIDAIDIWTAQRSRADGGS